MENGGASGGSLASFALAKDFCSWLMEVGYGMFGANELGAFFLRWEGGRELMWGGGMNGSFLDDRQDGHRMIWRSIAFSCKRNWTLGD